MRAVKGKAVKVDPNDVIFSKLDTLLTLATSAKIAQERVAGVGGGRKIKSAGTTVRNTMQEIKSLAQEIRQASLAQTKGM